MLGGIGTALLILLWSEFYGRLAPLRVALLYSLSIVLAGFLVRICQGFLPTWLVGAAACLPLLSLVSVILSFRELSVGERPTSGGMRAFPWKPIALMALYGFAYGMEQAAFGASEEAIMPHSSWGTLLVGAAVFLGVTLRGTHFDFSLVYRSALPLMIVAFLVLPAFGVFDGAVSSYCINASYAAFQILIMMVLANLCYRYGMSAVWLFGLERGLRSLFIVAGRQTGTALAGLSLPFDPIWAVSALAVCW